MGQDRRGALWLPLLGKRGGEKRKKEPTAAEWKPGQKERGRERRRKTAIRISHSNGEGIAWGSSERVAALDRY